MPNPESYEPLALYKQRQQFLMQTNSEREQITAAMQPKRPGGLLGGLTRGLELAGRPISGVATGVQAGFRGQNPIEGFMRGIRGESETRGFGDVLRQAGLPGWAATPLGFGLDVALDPITLATLPLGGGPSVLGRGLRAITPVAARKATAEAIAPATSVFRQLAERPVSAMAQQAAKVPGLKQAVGFFNPSAVTDSNLKRSLIAFNDTRVANSNVRNRLLAPLKQLKDPFQYDESEHILVGGKMVAWADAFDNPALVAQMTPEQQAFVQSYKQAKAPLWAEARAKGVDFGDLGLDADEVITSRLVIGSQVPGTPGSFRPIGGRRGIQRARKYKTMEQGIQHGEVYAKPVETLEVKLAELQDSILFKDFADYLGEKGIAKSAAKLAAAKKTWSASRKEFRATRMGELTVEGMPKKEAGRQITSELLEKEIAGTIPRPGMAEAIRPGELRGIPGSTALKGLRFEPEEATEIIKHFVPQLPGKRPLGFLQKATDVSRSFMATLDTSAPFIQGIPLMVTNPAGWLKSVGWMVRAIANPENHYKLISQNADFLARHPRLAVSGSEFTAGTKFLQKTPIVGGMFRRAGAGFDAFGDAARISMGKSLEGTAARLGRTDEMADFVNKSTGQLSGTLGIGPRQSALEGTFLMFSPRYTRATLALVGDVLRGGLVGEEARNAMSHMLLAGTAMFMRVAEAADLSDEEIISRLDPTKGSFMTIPVAGNNVGIGGTFVALARLLVKSAANPAGLTQYNLASLDEGNPLLQFLRSRAAPAGGTVWDIIDQETYVGEPLEDPIDIAKYATTRFLPFAIEGTITQGLTQGLRPQEMAVGAVAQFAGVRTFPMGLRDVREQRAKELFQKPYTALTPEEQVQLEKEPRIAEMPLPKGKQFERLRQTEGIFEDYGTQLEQVAQQVRTGQQTKEGFRMMEGVLADKRNAQLEMLEEPKRRVQLTPQEQKRKEYFAIFRERDEFGRVPYDKAEEYFASLDTTTQKYIEDKQLAAFGRLPDAAANLMRDLWQARRKLEDYWELREKTMKRLGIWDKWQAMTPAEQDKFTDNPIYKRAETLWTGERKRMRWAKPEVDKSLVEWGYASTPIRQQRG